ncbi:hypothetical protein BOTBODRAFT_619876 [Botryobasidium botryosum FD-172 SS1]|uniref:C2 domain-containing protein n=1 Tax=Botryobasidium botryosum (strain FD-172 SS1) TaxID=930990 RepID=A0A067MYJ3_BOTB1|nr:hypothetical protein BOTBODRAFT_619876 [Botryobasidium botryosum FD-172 SS1]
MQPKAPVEPRDNGEVRESNRDSYYHTRLSDALSNSYYTISDVVKDLTRDGSKSVKFPERLLKALDTKMQNIAMGKEPGYTDQLTRRVIAVFWGNLGDPNTSRHIKENRKIEELILMFVTTATAALKKDPQLQQAGGEGWKIELNNQIALFVRMVHECLKTISHVPPELMTRMEMYTSKLVPQQYPSPAPEPVGTSRAPDPGPAFTPLRVENMPLVQTVAQLFGRTDQDVLKLINDNKAQWTEKAAMVDLKTCLKNINTGAAFPGRKEDFSNEAGYQHWRTLELAHLQQLTMVMVKFNSDLARTTPSEGSSRPESLYVDSRDSFEVVPSPSSRNPSVSSSRYSLALPDSESPADGEGSDHFTFIPPNPKKYYKRLLEICIQYDLAAMVSLPEDQEVSLGILSPRHLEVLNECALRWRIMHSYRVACFLDVIKYKYEREDVPIECIPEALQMVARATQELELDWWLAADLEYLAQTFAAIFNIFLGSLYHAVDNLATLKYDHVAPFVTVLEQIQESGLLDRYQVDVSARIQDFVDKIKVVAVHQYTDKMSELASQGGVNRALPLLLLTDYLEKQAKLLDKRFPEPLLGQADLVSLAMESQVPLFFSDLENARRALLEGSANQPTPDIPIEDIFALYRRTKTLVGMYKAFCPNADVDFDLVAYFEPYVHQWIINTDSKTAQWVNGAISADQFVADGPEGHSSSIVDLFESLRSPIDFVLDLKWPDEYQEARFFTAVSKTIARSIEQYCRTVEDLFMTEMFPRPPPEVPTSQKDAWINKAKQLAISGEKKVEPFNFTAGSCVKLNNIESARRLLDKMYARIDADRVASVLEKHGPPVPEKTARQRFLFTVKVIHAEGLVPLDSNPSAKLDTFVTLSDEHGNRLAKTRTIYETLDPRWEETFDLSVETSLWVMASVRDRALIGKHDVLGRGYLCLDPRRFGDFLAHDKWLELDTQGRILVRISMEGEKDDIQFHFGRAFRSLKRAESDMIRIFIDKMSPLIRHFLSRTAVQTLIKPSGGTTVIDYNKALGNVTALYRSAIGPSKSDVLIPLPQQDKAKAPPRGESGLTDVEIEQVIGPLFDYFETNLQVLNTSLSDATKEMVMTRVWKEILVVIEGLLIPPLSPIPSDMRPLSDKEVDIVFKWLKFMKDFFYAEGEGPVPLESLQNQKYSEIVSIRFYYDQTTDELMEECVRSMQQSLRAAPTMKKRAKTVYAQRNLGTIRDRKREKKEQKSDNNGEVILRILRMRPNTSDFIAQQLQIIDQIQSEQEKRSEARRGGSRAMRANSPLPPVPPLPSS